MDVRKGALLVAGLAALAGPSPLAAEIMVSANDAKQIRAGDGPLGSTPDTVSIIDIGRDTARVIATIPAPASLIGPPATAALSPDGRMAIVTASQAIAVETPPRIIPDGHVSVIDLRRPAAPRIVQTLKAGSGATGVAFDPKGRLVLIANAGDDSVSVHRVRAGRLDPAATVRLQPGSKPMMIRIASDGRAAWVVLQAANSLERLAIDGTRVTATGRRIVAGTSPYALSIAADGRRAYVTHLGGRIGAPAGAPGTIAVVDLATDSVLQQVDAGATPEHVALSPNGRHLLATIVNGSTARPDSPAYRDHGLLRVYALDADGIAPRAEARTGRWCQGAAWTADGGRILQQCADRREIEVYRFVGGALVRDASATLTFSGRPGALAATSAR